MVFNFCFLKESLKEKKIPMGLEIWWHCHCFPAAVFLDLWGSVFPTCKVHSDFHWLVFFAGGEGRGGRCGFYVIN